MSFATRIMCFVIAIIIIMRKLDFIFPVFRQAK